VNAPHSCAIGLAALALAFCAAAAADQTSAHCDSGASVVTPGRQFDFPRDHGSHPCFRTEWWYITGWLHPAHAPDMGFQITFFRSRTDPALIGANPSAFSPGQLLIAHAALSDPAMGRLVQDQRIARAGFGLAQASDQDTAVFIDQWRLERRGDAYLAQIHAGDFDLNLTLRAVQPEMRNGNQGFSQKGPQPESASYYYSIPHLIVSGSVLRKGPAESVRGEAWLDHEWSSESLDPQARGWDWIGLNFDDGSALMAFRIRALDGSTRWAGGTLRDAGGATRVLQPEQIAFAPMERWRSPRTGIVYPVRWRIRAADLQADLIPLIQDQENDTRATTGAIYWEGAIRALQGGHESGRGYLELTGYGAPLTLH
jgi:predicted secreted hydrolase